MIRDTRRARVAPTHRAVFLSSSSFVEWKANDEFLRSVRSRSGSWKIRIQKDSDDKQGTVKKK